MRATLTFKVNVLDLPRIYANLQPDEDVNNIINQLINTDVWIDGITRPLRHGDIFTLYDDVALKVKRNYINKFPKVLESFDTPTFDESSLTLSYDSPNVLISWTPDDTYFTELEIQNDSGQWVLQLIEIGRGEMSIEVPSGTTFRVRLRFTDGRGNFSRNYATASIEVPDAGDGTITFPLNEPMDGTSLIGDILYNATYTPSDHFVQLTPNESGQHGALGYIGELPLDFEVNFQYQYDGGADAVFFYFVSNETPSGEEGESAESGNSVNGYVVGISEYQEEIAIRYGNSTLASIDFSPESGVWYAVRVFVSLQSDAEGRESPNTRIWVYVDDELRLFSEDTTSRDVEGNKKLGLAARTGGISAIHRVKLLTIEETEAIPASIPPDVEDFELFSWGKRVWATWKYQPDYQYDQYRLITSDEDAPEEGWTKLDLTEVAYSSGNWMIKTTIRYNSIPNVDLLTMRATYKNPDSKGTYFTIFNAP